MHPEEESTESPTELVRRKAAAFKTELFSVALFIIGLVAALDPSLLLAILPVEYHGYAMIVSAICIYVLRRFTNGPAEPLIKHKR